MRMTITLPTDEIIKELNKLEKVTNKKLENAGATMLQALRVMGEEVQPTVPMEMGDLRGAVEQDIKIGTTTKLATFTLVYLSEYAKRLHENEARRYTTAGSGSNYLGSKLATQKDKLMRIIARALDFGK